MGGQSRRLRLPCVFAVGVRGDSATYWVFAVNTVGTAQILFRTELLISRCQECACLERCPAHWYAFLRSWLNPLTCWWGVTEVKHYYLILGQLLSNGHLNCRPMDGTRWGLCWNITVQVLQAHPCISPFLRALPRTFCTLISDSQFPRELKPIFIYHL